VGAAWKSALNIADRLDDTEFQLRALSALFWYRLAVGEYRLALQLAERFCALAVIGADRDDQLIGDRMLAAARHHLGDQPSARGHIEHMLAGYVAPERRSHVIRFGRDQGLAARGLLARILWLQGFLDQAVLAAQGAVDEAEASDHTMSLCGILADAACPIALLSGDLVTAERYVRMLLDRSARHALAYWQAAGRSFEAALVIKSGNADLGLQLLRSAAHERGPAWSPVWLIPLEGVLAEAVARAGLVADGLAAIDDALDRSERVEERVAIAELLRVRGEILRLQAGREAAAEACFRQAIDWARRQGALYWELRAIRSASARTSGSFSSSLCSSRVRFSSCMNLNMATRRR
jgi:hypothetical protein